MTPFYEDQLPPHQKPILTSNVTRMLTITQMMTAPAHPYTTIATVTGDAGTGKTIASTICQYEVETRFQTVLPICLIVKVAHRATSRTLAVDILKAVGEHPRERDTAHLLANEAATAIVRNDIRLLIFDEGDRLNDDSFEIVRYLRDKTGCPLLLIGLPSLLTVIERHEKFRSRVGLRIAFQPLPLEEVLTRVLPHLTISGWIFDPTNPEDRKRGTALWQRVGCSFRNLTSVLTLASQLARRTQQSTITDHILEEACIYGQSIPSVQKRVSTNKPSPGPHEQESEQRHQAKEEKQHA